MDKKYQIFVSSTYSDLIEERQAIFKAILMLDEIPAGMESFASFPGDQIKYIERLIDRCDYILMIVHANYGSSRTDAGISYTEYEYEYAKSKNKHIMVFVNDSRDGLEDNILREVLNESSSINKFKHKLKSENQVAFWTTAENLATFVTGSISRARIDNPAEGWVRTSTQSDLWAKIEGLLVDKIKLETEIRALKANPDDVSQIEQELSGRAAIVIEQSDDFNQTSKPLTPTWMEIFEIVAQYLYHLHDVYVTDWQSTPKRVEEILGTSLAEKYEILIGGEYVAEVSKLSFQDIHFKFKDLNLWSRQIYSRYALTDLGDKLYTRIRARSIMPPAPKD